MKELKQELLGCWTMTHRPATQSLIPWKYPGSTGPALYPVEVWNPSPNCEHHKVWWHESWGHSWCPGLLISFLGEHLRAASSEKLSSGVKASFLSPHQLPPIFVVDLHTEGWLLWCHGSKAELKFMLKNVGAMIYYISMISGVVIMHVGTAKWLHLQTMSPTWRTLAYLSRDLHMGTWI